MKLSHINKEGRSKMVDVSEKSDTVRIAKATGTIRMKDSTLQRILEGGIQKGDVLSVAQVAGIMAAKNTPTIIPMCHPLQLESIDISFTHNLENSELTVTSTVKLTGKTGVEMEALVAVNVSLLTVYDMCKAIDKDMEITSVYLLSKTGGKSGKYKRGEANG